MSVLVLAEHDTSGLKPATRNAVTAGAALGPVTLLVAGEACGQSAQQAATLTGVEKVLSAEGSDLAEAIAPMLVSLVKENGFTHVVAPATTTGKNVLPRAAALLDVMQVSDVVAIDGSDTFVTPIYAGNALARVRSKDAVKVLTVRTTAFDAAPDGGSAAVEEIPAQPVPSKAALVGRALTESDRPELTAARVVVSGGRGLGSAENFHMIEQLADKLGGAVGASRAAVDSGYVPNDCQVGQTGKVVAPELYVAVGISGAIQHLAGMKDSKVIVAINKDAEAPIFQVADYGLVADLFTALPDLVAELDKD